MQDKVVPVELTLNYIGFECSLKGDNDEIIDPYEMFWTITVKNNAVKPLMFGAYDPNHNPKNRKYGYFEFITEQDTIKMLSRYSDVYKIEPGSSFEFILSNSNLNASATYELSPDIDILHVIEIIRKMEECSDEDVALCSEYQPYSEVTTNRFSTIKDSSHVMATIKKLEKSSARYIPLEFEYEEGAYAVHEILDIKTDTLTVSYASEGKGQLYIEKTGNDWTYEIW